MLLKYVKRNLIFALRTVFIELNSDCKDFRCNLRKQALLTEHKNILSAWLGANSCLKNSLYVWYSPWLVRLNNKFIICRKKYTYVISSSCTVKRGGRPGIHPCLSIISKILSGSTIYHEILWQSISNNNFIWVIG